MDKLWFFLPSAAPGGLYAGTALELTGPLGAIASVLGLLLGFAAILAAAYWAARLAGTRYGGMSRNSRRTGGTGLAGLAGLEILERTAVGQDRCLLIARAGGKVLLLGSTPQSIRLLCELDPELFPQPTEEPSAGYPQRVSFADTLEEIKKRYTGFTGRGESPAQKEERDGKD